MGIKSIFTRIVTACAAIMLMTSPLAVTAPITARAEETATDPVYTYEIPSVSSGSWYYNTDKTIYVYGNKSETNNNKTTYPYYVWTKSSDTVWTLTKIPDNTRSFYVSSGTNMDNFIAGKSTYNTGVQTNETWEHMIARGSTVVTLEASINENGEQQWDYTYYVEDNSKQYNVYEKMTGASNGYLLNNYTSTGSDSTDENHVWAVETDPGKSKVTKDSDGKVTDNSYTISNAKEGTTPTIPEYGSLSLTKTVTNPDKMQNAEQAFTFTIKLSNTDSSKLSGTKIFGSTVFKNGEATVSLKQGQTVTFTDIPVGTTYAITENDTTGYTLDSITGDGTITLASRLVSGTIEKDATKSATFTNTSTYTPPERSYASFTLKKNVSDPANLSADTEYTFHVVFTGLEQYDQITITKNSDDPYASDQADSTGFLAIEIALKDKDSVVFSNIPATIIETDSKGNKTTKSAGVSYQVTEDVSEGVTPSYVITKDKSTVSEAAGSQGESLATIKQDAETGSGSVITYTNTVERLQDVILKKISVKADGETLDEADKNTTYYITATFSNLKPGDRIVTSNNGVLIADDDGIAEMTFQIKPSETITFKDIPVGTDYQFTETEDTPTGKNNKIASYIISGDNLKTEKTSNSNTKAQTELSTEVETVDANEKATVTFTNATPAIAKIEILKYDADEKTPLGGAEFALYRAAEDDSDEDPSLGEAVNFTKDSTGQASNIIVIGKNGSSGELSSDLFAKGKYYLVETVAPEGHTISGSPIAFTIDDEDLGSVKKIAVTDDKLIELPVTGGTGRTTLFAIAGTITALGIVLIVVSKKRRTA